MATAEEVTHDTLNDDDVTVPVMEEKTTEEAIEEAIYEDPDLVEVIEKLNKDVSIEPDRDLNIGETNSQTPDSDSISTSSSHRDIEDNECSSPESSSSLKNGKLAKESDSALSSANHSNGKSSSKETSFNHKIHRRSIDSTASRESSLSNEQKSSSGSKTTSRSSIKNPLKALKKLTKFDKSSESKRRKSTSQRSEFTAVIVDKLPQVFVVKYMGSRPVNGLSGLHVVRQPVDEMVKEVREKLDKEEETELPLLYVVVSSKGLDLREHKRNKVKDQAPLGIMPIDFISYGVQDIKYWRVFSCIEVKELSSRTPKSATCHAFLCDSSYNGRKMALSIGAAFSVHAKKLKTAGKTHNFQVELRPPDELADALEDCEA